MVKMYADRRHRYQCSRKMPKSGEKGLREIIIKKMISLSVFLAYG